MAEPVFWADQVVEEITKKKRKEYVCEGMWTPSGFFHIGNARSEVFTPYAVYRALRERGFRAKQNFIIDDFDPLDKIPAGIEVKELEHEQFLGRPCALAPSPAKGYKSWADFFVSQMKEGISSFGVELQIMSAYETYRRGQFNDLITYSLDHSREIVSVWNEIAGSEKPPGFVPVQMLCESCGVLSPGISWDGGEVSYKCTCGHSASAKPLNGNAKLHWRVHWAAHWLLHDVCFESAGKDHFSRGGSVDVGHAIMRKVFKKEPPYMVPTEFIQLRGAKMAGSVGNVIDLGEWLEVASPELFRFLNFSYRPNAALDMNLADNSFLLLHDRFERAERIFYGLEKGENKKTEEKMKKTYALSLIEPPSRELGFQLPYSFAVLIAQLVDPAKELSRAIEIMEGTGHIKGKLTGKDKAKLRDALVRAGHWAQKYAPEECKVQFAKEAPPAAKEMLGGEMPATAGMLAAAGEIAQKMVGTKNADKIQQIIFDAAKKNNIPAKDVFRFIYLSVLGRETGPKAGSLIIALGREKVAERLNRMAEYSKKSR